MMKQKWTFPLIALVLVLGLYAPVNAVCMEGSWFALTIGQIIPAVLVMVLIVLALGLLLGYLVDRNEAVLQKYRMLVFGAVIGALLCAFFLNNEAFLIILLTAIWVYEIMMLDKTFSDLLADIFLGVALAVFVQLLFLDRNLPVMNTIGEWMDVETEKVISFHVWALCLILPGLSSLFHREDIEKWVRGLLSAGLSATAVIVTVLLACGIGAPENGQWYASKNGEFELSPNENIIVFSIDQMDEQWIGEYVVNNARYMEMLYDFTHYSNVTAPTSASSRNLPALLTGSAYPAVGDKSVFYSDAYQNSPLIKEMQKGNRALSVLASKEHLSDGALIAGPDGIGNLVRNPVHEIRSMGAMIGDVLKLTQYYAVPYSLKPGYVFNTDLSIANIPVKAADVYQEDVKDVADDLRDQGLSTGDESLKMVLYNLNGIDVVMNDDEIETNLLNTEISERFDLIMDYIVALKELGLYDSATIMITGGQGYNQLNQNVPLFVKWKKGYEANLGADAPITFAGIQEMIIASMNPEQNAQVNAMENSGIARTVFVDPEVRNAFYADQMPIGVVTRFLIGGGAADEALFFEAPSLPTAYDYTLGDIIEFCGEKPTSGFVASGLSANEITHRWTDGTGLAMRFHIDEPHGDLSAEIQTGGVFLIPQRVYIYANGHLLDVQTVSEPQVVRFTIPENLIVDNDLEIILGLPDSQMPSETIGSADTRRLGICVDSMVIQ